MPEPEVATVKGKIPALRLDEVGLSVRLVVSHVVPSAVKSGSTDLQETPGQPLVPPLDAAPPAKDEQPEQGGQAYESDKNGLREQPKSLLRRLAGLVKSCDRTGKISDWPRHKQCGEPDRHQGKPPRFPERPRRKKIADITARCFNSDLRCR